MGRQWYDPGQDLLWQKKKKPLKNGFYFWKLAGWVRMLEESVLMLLKPEAGKSSVSIPGSLSGMIFHVVL